MDTTPDFIGILMHSRIQAAALTFFYYDYLLTLGAEVSHVWPQPVTWHGSLFYLNRYLGISSNLAAAFIYFTVRPSQESCSNPTVGLVREALVFLNQVVVAAILCRRTIALYNRSRAVSILLWGVGLLLVGVCSSSLLLIHPNSDFVRVVSDLPGCHYLSSQQAAIHYAFAWEASAIFDTLIFTLTLVRTIKMRKVHRMSISLTGEGLMDIFLRDGALFFAIMALANVANICTLYFAGPSFRGALTTTSSCISSALCSRLVLNLYEAATPDDTSSRSSHEPMTTVILTVPIDLDITTFDDCSEV